MVRRDAEDSRLRPPRAQRRLQHPRHALAPAELAAQTRAAPALGDAVAEQSDLWPARRPVRARIVDQRRVAPLPRAHELVVRNQSSRPRRPKDRSVRRLRRHAAAVVLGPASLCAALLGVRLLVHQVLERVGRHLSLRGPLGAIYPESYCNKRDASVTPRERRRPRSPEIARRGPEIARDSARSPIARRGPRSPEIARFCGRRGGWVGSEGAEVFSAVDGKLEAREPDL